MAMRRSLFFTTFFSCCLACFQAKAQLPICSGPGSGIIYLVSTGDTIFNYDPSLPLSASNPAVNSITLPANSIAKFLAVGENLGSISPSPTFYTVAGTTSQYYYYYYNGSTWVSTGYSPNINSGPMAGGGSNIYRIGGGIYHFNGTSNESWVVGLTTPNQALAADCNDNFYTISSDNGWLHKYSPSGSLLQSWTLSSTTTQSGDGLAIIGNNVYYGTTHVNTDSIMTGTISSSSTINVSGQPISHKIHTFATCPAGEHVAVASADTFYYCNGTPTTLIGYGSGNLTWSVLSGPAIINGSGDTVTVSTSATSQLVLSSDAFLYCGANKDTVTLIDTNLVMTPLSNSPVCSGDSLKLTAGSPQTNIVYGWSGPNNFTDSLAGSFIYPASAADSGYYTLTESFHNCSSADSILVHIKPAPAIPAASSNSPLCVGDTLKLHISNPQTGVNYSWAGPSSFSASTQNSIRANVVLIDSGKYRVKATLNGCSSGFDTTDVVINAVVVPSVSISSLPAVITPGHVDTFTATSNCSSASYQWYKNGTAIPGATTNPYLTLLAAGDHISVKVHCNGCANPDTALSNSLTTVGIPPGLSKGEVMIWPNPVGEIFNLSLTEGDGVVRVYSAVGQLVYTSSVHKGLNTIDTKHFPAGSYILELKSADGYRYLSTLVKL